MYISMLLAAQAQFNGCFTFANCTSAVVGPSSNAEDCCVNNDAGLYYSNGGLCFQCIGKCIIIYASVREVYCSVLCVYGMLQLLKE